ncbi:hypothetical protein B7P43_G13975 [Cryptotermes secundus]|uniref:Mos1 transposase HTH domain-containing protein n=1 Tax=Cryptotermes secundus TaxID=105785 RepID=A0A2J7QD82_9NEOP|nr:hypothetical protein B7P43_G13975 [Cryptotermes secundus]
MANNDISFCQCAVIESLVKEEIPAAEIHQRLQHAYGSVCMGASSVRNWVKHFKDGNTSVEDEPRSSRPRTPSTECNKERVDEIIQDDRHVTVDIVTGDKSWFHHFEPETKRQSMEQHHLHSPSKKKARTVPSAEKVMGTIFWDSEGFWPNSWNLGKVSMLLVFRCCTSSVVHCAVNIQDETSSCTPLTSHRKQL